jgi:uncharacterized protein (DUF1499 family)
MGSQSTSASIRLFAAFVTASRDAAAGTGGLTISPCRERAWCVSHRRVRFVFFIGPSSPGRFLTDVTRERRQRLTFSAPEGRQHLAVGDERSEEPTENVD